MVWSYGLFAFQKFRMGIEGNEQTIKKYNQNQY